MSWPKRLRAAHGPMLEAADAGEPTGPSRPVALHTRGYASGLAPRFGTGVVVGNSHAIRLANTAVNQILAAQQAPLGIGPPASAAGLCGRLTEPQDCESAIHA